MTPDNQILDAENQLIEAMKSGDVATLDRLLHDHLVFIIPTGQTITKEMDLDNYRSGRMKVTDITLSERAIVEMDDLATVTVTLFLKARYANQPVEGNFRYLRVWKKTRSGWKIIAGSGISV